MSIDWITVIAQIANFLALVWLLKRFLIARFSTVSTRVRPKLLCVWPR